MSLRYHPKHAAVLAAVAGLFWACGAGAIETNADPSELVSAFSGPVSAPCHPALAACTKRLQRSASFANGALAQKAANFDRFAPGQGDATMG